MRSVCVHALAHLVTLYGHCSNLYLSDRSAWSKLPSTPGVLWSVLVNGVSEWWDAWQPDCVCGPQPASKLTHGSIFSIGKTPIIIKHSSALKLLNQTTTNVFSQQFCPHVKTTMQEPKHTSETSLCLLTLWGTGERKLQSCVEKHRMVKADHQFFFLLLSLSFALTLWAAALRLITFSPCDHFCSLADPKAVGGSLYSWPPQAKLASDFTFPCLWILCSCGKCDKER